MSLMPAAFCFKKLLVEHVLYCDFVCFSDCVSKYVAGPNQVNLAVYKPAFQSSTLKLEDGSEYPANLAVDGIHNAVFSAGHCTHTTQEENPWWMVDLQAETEVSSVTITNREDCCCKFHIIHFIVVISFICRRV